MADHAGEEIVFQSRLLPPGDQVVVNLENGGFVGKLVGKRSLSLGEVYFVRILRGSVEVGESDWSCWCRGFGLGESDLGR